MSARLLRLTSRVLPVAFAGSLSLQVGDDRAATVSLKVGATIDVDVKGGALIAGPARCDADGNIFFVPYEVAGTAEPGRRDKVIRLSADGKKNVVNLSKLLNVGEEDAQLSAFSLDNGGGLNILVDVRRGAGSRQYIVSLDGNGKYESKVELDPQEMVVDHLAVFDSGEFLLIGQRAGREDSGVAIMAAEGGHLYDVHVPLQPTVTGLRRPTLTFTESAPGGVVYVAQSTSTVGYDISPSGDFNVVPLPRSPRVGTRLVGLRLSGQRVAAVFQEDVKSSQGSSVRWLATQDRRSGENYRAYGPLTNLVMCYRSDAGSRDRFTLLQVRPAGWQILDALSP